jgi:hypothetical protein
LGPTDALNIAATAIINSSWLWLESSGEYSGAAGEILRVGAGIRGIAAVAAVIPLGLVTERTTIWLGVPEVAPKA